MFSLTSAKWLPCHLRVQRANKYLYPSLVPRLFVSLPSQEAHQSYPIGLGVAGCVQKMHPKSAYKICDFVLESTTVVPEF